MPCLYGEVSQIGGPMRIDNLIKTLMLYQFGKTQIGDKVLKPKSFDLKDEDCETIRDALALVGMIAESEPSKDKMEKFRIVARDICKCTP